MAHREPVRKTAKPWNHPSHPHQLTLQDAQTTYRAYEGKWRCDVCLRVFDARRAPPMATSHRDTEDPDQRHFYHCPRCNFDVCSACFKGRLHTFHFHRLKKARSTIVYPDADALWRCDACKTVHSEHTEQVCYHCQKCEVDLCSVCFEGTWNHILHSDKPDPQEHTLKPMDPRIEYRAYQQWVCDNCRRSFSCSQEHTVFHCGKCNFDLCEPCFSGKKHHLHSHPLIAMEAKTYSRGLECSQCEKSIRGMTYYHCRKPSCHYILCLNCHSKQPIHHPYHTHPLHVTDPQVVYPQSGGMWHCDQCTSNSFNRQPVPLSYTEIMYHCETCEYDLCHGCYTAGLTSTSHSSVQEEAYRPVQVAEASTGYNPSPQATSEFSYASGLDTYQPYTQATYYTSQSRLSRPLVTGMQTPSLNFFPSVPSHKLCRLCQRSEATATFVHRGLPHSGPPLCCSSCASDVVTNRRPCPACRIPPEKVFHLPQY